MANNSNNSMRWAIGILVTICMAAIVAVAGFSSSGDNKLQVADLKLDQDKLDKAYFKQHEKTQEKDEQRRWDLLQGIDKKLNEALKK